MWDKLVNGVMDAAELRMITNVLKRMIAEEYVPRDIEKQHAAGAFLVRMYFKGMVLEDRLYDIGVAMAKVRFQDADLGSGEVRLPLIKVLIVEDDYHLATDVQAVFEKAGAIVLGPVAGAQDAVAILESEVPDLAILDLNLGEGVSFDVAERLRQQSVPICVHSAYRRADIGHVPEGLGSVPWLEKPQTPKALLRAAARAVH